MNEHRNNRDRSDSRTESPIERNVLIDLTKKEQDHRHKLQENQQKANNSSYFFGMILGVIYNLSLLYLIYDLINDGYRALALKLFIINAFLILSCFGLLTFSRKLSFKKPFNKNYDNRRNFKK
jgi:uncharacterized membrane protein